MSKQARGAENNCTQFPAIKFKDLIDDYVQIITYKDIIYNVLRINRTLFHRHKYVVLLRLNAHFIKNLTTIRVYEHEFKEAREIYRFRSNKCGEYQR